MMVGMISTTRLLVAVWSLAIVLATAGVAHGLSIIRRLPS
jgi:hypothetical protein